MSRLSHVFALEILIFLNAKMTKNNYKIKDSEIFDPIVAVIISSTYCEF